MNEHKVKLWKAAIIGGGAMAALKIWKAKKVNPLLKLGAIAGGATAGYHLLKSI